MQVFDSLVPFLKEAIEYGIVGLALYMMYSITYNHLTSIQTTLVNIENVLEVIKDKL